MARVKNWEAQERDLRRRTAARRAEGRISPWRELYEIPFKGKGKGKKGRSRSNSKGRGKGKS